MSTDWKHALADRLPADLAHEIDVYEQQLELKRQGRLDDKVFAETRLRRGAYGQRYDNGLRHDGVAQRRLEFPCGGLTKGPDTVWDAPGMQRIKVPFGGLTPEQLEVVAELAEEYSDGILHVTTRQDFQLHYVHIDDTPDLMRRLAAVGITTREACGNSVRNITACPTAGVCPTEAFDTTPYAEALFRFLLGHPDTQDFGRKFKIAFSGCAGSACGLVRIHDLGLVARRELVDGRERRGFTVYVGGGLGAVPYEAKVLEEFLPVDELLPLAQAIARVFARLGEKRNRNRARLKFLVDRLGIDEFRRLVMAERAALPADPRWTSLLAGHDAPAREAPPAAADAAGDVPLPPAVAEWARSNTRPQRQQGYVVATVALPLGDLSSAQARGLADIARRFAGGDMRTTVEQNIVLRWVRRSELPALHEALDAIGLGAAGAGTIVDVTACPGTDTCKLGIAGSRGLAATLRERLAVRYHELDAAAQGLHIKVSGCFNSCGQHHLADLGFYGVSRKVDGTTVPHFRVLLGGQWEGNGAAYGLPIGVVPSKRVPEFVDRMVAEYLRAREPGEGFQAFVARIGKKACKQIVDEFAAVPPYAEAPEYYSDWRDPREFTISDRGVGECAGEVVSRIDFELQEAERLYFEAQIHLDEGRYAAADDTAYQAMLRAAAGLVSATGAAVPDEPQAIVDAFRERFVDTGLFERAYGGAQAARYLLLRHADRERRHDRDQARHLVEEAQLFIEAVHRCQAMLEEQQAGAAPQAEEVTA